MGGRLPTGCLKGLKGLKFEKFKRIGVLQSFVFALLSLSRTPTSKIHVFCNQHQVGGRLSTGCLKGLKGLKFEEFEGFEEFERFEELR